MAVQVKVRHDRQIICPIRFTRAATGPPVIDAPEVDDRGFAMGNRAGTWGQSRARGAMVGITEGDTCASACCAKTSMPPRRYA